MNKKGIAKKVFAAFLALAVMITYTPVTFAEPQTDQTVTVDSWEALQNAVDNGSNNGKTIQLQNDIACTNNDSIKVDGDNVSEITIDLSGHTMNRNRSSSTGDGHVINVKDGANLTITSSSDGGKLTGGHATDGGGIKIEKNSKCVINDTGSNGTGVIIEGNRSKKDGGGIYVYGTLEMNGGSIKGNNAGDEGGGIYVEDSGSLNIKDVTISENASEDDGGGLRVDLRESGDQDGKIANCTITDNKTTESDGGGLSLEAGKRILGITNTTFTGNTASDEGGAINVDGGELQMTGGRISGSKAVDGGGIMNDGCTLSLESVEISSNTVTQINGGGITNKNSGTAQLKNCKLTGNIAKSNGGGIYSDGILKLEGGIIGGDNNSYNMAYEGGGGVWAADGSIELSGAPIVTDNRSSDIYLCKDIKLKITDVLKDSGDPSKKAKVGVVLSKSTGVFTEGFSENNPGEEPFDYFIPEPGHSVVLDGNEARINASNWGNLQQKINKAHNNDVINLDADYKATADDTSLKIPAGLVLTINLNGHILDRNCGSKPENGGSVIELLSDEYTSSKLIIRDKEGSGKITGGWSEKGGGIYVNTNCSLTVQGGSITGNKADNGGAIYCDTDPASQSENTTVNIEGGNISENEAAKGGAIYSAGTTQIDHEVSYDRTIIQNNKANEDGGAVYIASGTTTILNGAISDNTASQNGGAVYINEGGALELYGGSITSNSASEGGGIWHGAGTMKAQGTPAVIENRATNGRNIMLRNGKVIQITGELKIGGGTTANAMLDIMTDDITNALTSGLGNCVPEGSEPEDIEKRAGYVFTYNKAAYKDSMEIKNNELYHKDVNMDLTVSSWAELQAAVDNRENEGKTIGLACDIEPTNDDDNHSINVDGDNLGDSKSITIELCGHKMDRKRDDDTGDGHAINVEDGAFLTVKDSIGTGLITGGNATDGGAIMIEEDSKCDIHNVTIKGNKADKDGGGIYVSGSLTMTGGNVTGNIADDEGGGIYVEDSGRIDLDGVTISGNESDGDGGGLNIHLRKSDNDPEGADGTIKNCVIKNNKTTDSDGGGFSFDADERTLVVTNTKISGNTADDEAGGIYLGEGRINMNGFESVISNNTGNDGGGVMNVDGIIDFQNIRITGNNSSNQSGGGINNKNDAYLTNVTISNNRSNDAGGGVYSKSSDLELKHCFIKNNNASNKGGGLFTKDDAMIDNCSFESNKAQKGGAIYLSDGDVTIKDTSITKNEVDENGGGIYVEDGNPVLDGGSITENKANMAGSGIYVDDDLKIKGVITVKDNVGSGIYLCSDEKLDIAGALYNGDNDSHIDVTLEKGSGVFTNGFPGNNPERQPFDVFSADAGFSVIKNKDGEGEIAESEWPLLQRMINEAAADVSGGGDIPMLKLDRDWKATNKDVALTIPEGKRIVIDLAGFTIDRNRNSADPNGNVFLVSSGSTLVIKDSSNGGKGTVKGGWAEKGGAINLQTGAVCTIKSGKISGNKADSGGGFFVSAGASLTVTGGSINNNTATDGGGIYMEDGDPRATVTLTGGMISGNTADVGGGGIRAGSNGLLNVSDQPFVKGNSGSAGKNILLEAGNVINITDPLVPGSEGGTGGARLDLAARDSDGEGTAIKLTNGLSESLPHETTAASYAKEVFTYNEGGYDEFLEIGEDGELYKKALNVDDYVWVSDWEGLQNAVRNPDNKNKVIGLSKDITADHNYSIKIDYYSHYGSIYEPVRTIIDLNGHKLDRNRGNSADSDGNVISVIKDAELTIRDSAGTGTITGGNHSGEYKTGLSIYEPGNGGGITIEEHSKCTIEGGTVCGNKTDGNGGGIYTEGELIMTGGAVSDNETISDTIDGIGGGIACYYSEGTINLSNATISGNKAVSHGGGIATDISADQYIENCHITDNWSGEMGGGIFVCMSDNIKKMTIEGTEISGNTAAEGAGGIYNSGAEITMSGGSVSKNNAKNGAGIINNKRSINLTGVSINKNNAGDNGGGIANYDNATLTDCVITENISGADGAGIYTQNLTTITGGSISDNNSGGSGGGIFICDQGDYRYELTKCQMTGTQISGNKTNNQGGGIFIDKDVELSLNGCTINKNEAGSDGGGICSGKDSVLFLNGGTINENSSGEYGGGIYVSSNAEDVNITGAVTVSDNIGGSDVYLEEGNVLNIIGSLADGDNNSNIGILFKDGLEEDFTDDYSDYNNVDPAIYFTSNEDYEVYLKDGEEAALRNKEVIVDPNPFIEKNSQMNREYTNLSGRDWMSGISGERYLNEINMPGTHDSCTKDMEGNVSTGYMSLIAGGIGVVAGMIFGPGTSLIFGASLPLLAAEHFAKFAETQRRYVDEQLADGIRSLDLRVNTYYSKKGYPPNRKDDGTNLWVLHGKNSIGGSFFAKKKDGDFMNLKDVFGYCKEFLEKYPTESIIVSIAIQGIDVDDEKALERLNQHIRTLSQEINPSTGESYLYMEDGDYMKELDNYPKLKDCRGKIIIEGDTVGNGSGGLRTESGMSAVYRPEGGFTDDSKLKIKHLKAFYSKYGYDPLPTDASNGKQVIDYYYAVGTNCTDPATVPGITPLEYAKDVLPVLFDDGGLLTDRQGLYLGLVNMDDANAKNNRQVWITNFGKLEYCTVVSKASPNDTNPKVYTVLKNTPISIPECIYPDPNDKGNYFEYWKATKGAGEGETADFIGSYYPDATFTVTDDVTFTAVWEQDGKSNIRVVWNDGNDADGIRPDKLDLTVTEDSTEDPRPTYEVPVTAKDSWSNEVSYNVWRGEETQKGITVNNPPEGYDYEVKGTKITMTHKPEKSVYVHGQIEWRDGENEGNTRPERTTLELYANGKEKKEIQPTAKGHWNYDFGEIPLYEADEKGNYKKIIYRLEEDKIDGYSVYTSPIGDGKNIEVINSLVTNNMTIEGMVLWVDGNNEKGKRPEEVTVHLHAKGKEVGSRKVSKDDDGYWTFSFPMDQGIPFSGYSITVDPVKDYLTQTYIESIDGVAYVINSLNTHEHEIKEVEGVTKEPTCEEKGVKATYRYCLTCGKVFGKTETSIPALGHDWGRWKTVKEATTTESGEERRTCKRDPSHIQTRITPPTSHIHDAKKIEARPATCTEDGNIAYYYCEGCGWYFLDGAHPGTTWIEHGDEVLPAIGHVWGKPGYTWADDLSSVTAKRVCKNDSSHIESETANATSKITKKATCAEKGEMTYVSDNFKNKAFESQTKTKDIDIDPDSHDWGEWFIVEKPTETKEGTEMRVCRNNLSHTEKRSIPKVPHEHKLTKIASVPASCTENGNTEYWICDKGENPCGRYFSDSKGIKEIKKADTIIKATGHKYGPWKKLNGKMHQKICNHDKSHVLKAKHRWNSGKVTKKPTYTKKGVKIFTCKDCKAAMTKKIPKKKTGSFFIRLKNRKGGKLAVSGKSLKNMDGYDIFFTRCDHNNKKSRFKKVRTIKKGRKIKWSKKGLKKGIPFKAYARAFVKEKGRKVYVKTSPTVHAYVGGNNNQYTNAKKLKLKKTEFKLKVGKKAVIKAKVIKLRKKMKLISESHTAKLRYYSSNKKVATVSKNGRITARGKGKCKISVITHNGITKKINITVR